MKKHLYNTCAILAVLVGTAQLAGAALSLTDTIELLPGPDAYFPQQLALNHATHKVYVLGAAASGFQDLAIKVVDSTTSALVGNIDLGQQPNGSGGIDRFAPRGVAADESTNANGNRVYVIGLLGNSYYVRTIQNDAVVAGADVALGRNPDPYVGFSPITVNSNTHKVYFVSDNGDVIVVDGPSHTKLTTFSSTTGFGPHLWVTNPDANKIFLFGRSGAVVIDGASDTVTPITVPAQFSATTGVYNSATGRVYAFGSGNSGIPGIYSFDSNGANAGSVATSPTLAGRGMTVDPATNTIYLGEPEVNGELGGIFAYSGADLSTKGTFNQGAAWLAFDSGRIFLCDYDFSDTFAETRNRLGILNVTNGSLSAVTVAYNPYKAVVNAQTNRVYVVDQVNADLVVINGADHSIIARVPVNPANSGSYNAKFIVPRVVAVSEALNRIYLPRFALIASDGTKTTFLDVIDGSSNQLITSIPLSTGFIQATPYLAVDDNRHRVYVTGADSSNNPLLRVINADTNSVTTSFATFNSVTGLAVNPVTGKIYVSGRPSGGQVQIFDGATFGSLGIANAGAVPGPMAVNTATNKVYVANTGAGSVDNSVTVIDGATNATETTFSNTHQNNGDAVSDVAVDPATNKIYVADDSNGFDATGRITIFNGANNSFQQQIEVGRYPTGIAFNTASKELFVPNNESGNISVIGSGVPPPPPAPPHGGLSATVFRINGSQSPTGNLADTALHFSAQQSGGPAGLKVRVQINTVADNNRIDWVDLNNGSNGYMTIDKSTGQFVLSSTNYPLANGLYFRALSTAPGYPDSKSNIVGPFNLSANQTHLGTTVIYMATNGGGQEMKFRAKVGTDQAGIALRIQTTTSPDDDSTWRDLNDGNSGGMHPFADPKQFYLDTTKYPAGDAIYFRAVATAPGFLNSVSNILGVTKVVNGTPPDVNAFPSTLDQLQSGSGSGTTPNDPLILKLGSMKFTAQASSPENRALTVVAFLYDGSVINKSEGSAVSGTLNTDYFTTVPGDHIIKAFAKDERGVLGFADPVYIRILPAGGKLFKMTNSGDWSDPANWRDSNGQSGVPGAADVAIVGALNATVGRDITAFSVSLIGGAINGNGGSLKVPGMFSIAAGQLRNLNLTIDSHGTLAITSNSDVPVSGSVNNFGTVRFLGAGSIIPVPATSSLAGEEPQATGADAGIFDGIAAFFKNVGDFIFHPPAVKPKPASVPQNPPQIRAPRGVSAASFVNQGRLITNDGGSLLSENGLGLISPNGAGLIAPNGASIIGNDGASLITNDGGSVISNDGNSLITNDGGSLITNDGGSLITNDGGSLRVRPNANARAFSNAVRASAATGAVTQSAGQLDLRHLLILSSLSIDGGVVTGSGVIAGDLTNNAGFISPGTISVLGNFAQASGGTLIIENGGAVGGQSDFLQIAGSATLGGKIDLRDIKGYTPSTLDTFSPLGSNSVSGSFSSISSNAQVTMTTTGVLAAVNPSAPAPSTGQPLNIATRMKVLTSDNVLIAGFIVTGPSGSTKKVLIRGLGPSLAQFGVPGTLSDPLLELHNGNTTITNDNWQQGDTSQIPNGFAPSDSRESVIVATLAPGNYSAVVKGAHGETGIGIAELYDLDSASPAKLANISTRGFINTGDDVMIGGFIVGGTEPAKILVRAIGPTLTDFGVQGALADPTLELHDSNGMTISNDDWRETQESEIMATTIPPNKSQEPAILAILVPGNYTAVVRGKNNTTGVGLVEAYNLQ